MTGRPSHSFWRDLDRRREDPRFREGYEQASREIQEYDARMNSRITAPWSPEQVLALNYYQHAGIMHPYTCYGRRPVTRRRCGRDLVATADGWVCPRLGCRYRQTWAHAWTADSALEETNP